MIIVNVEDSGRESVVHEWSMIENADVMISVPDQMDVEQQRGICQPSFSIVHHHGCSESFVSRLSVNSSRALTPFKFLPYDKLTKAIKQICCFFVTPGPRSPSSRSGIMVADQLTFP
jgi:hypothetical protein